MGSGKKGVAARGALASACASSWKKTALLLLSLHIPAALTADRDSPAPAKALTPLERTTRSSPEAEAGRSRTSPQASIAPAVGTR